MNFRTRCSLYCFLSFLISLMILSVSFAATPATPVLDSGLTGEKPDHESFSRAKDPGDLVDFAAALAAGAGYVLHAQADVTEDNAGNGTDGVDEDPDDPDDGGWDWSLSGGVFTHSATASSTNLYGATAQGMYHAYLATGDASLITAMTDAADIMVANTGIRSGADLVFLMNYNDLPGVSGTAYMDAAKAKFDSRITDWGTPTGLAVYIRDVRGITQGYPNGIIGWDIGIWAVAAAMLGDRYPADPADYSQGAIDIAEVLWQDSFNDSPGFFDIIDDQGFDSAYGDVNFWWYNLGITGLIDAFDAAGVHTEEIPGLVAILLAGQHSNGGVGYCYGVNTDDEDWQSTAYAVLTLANLDQVTYQPEINRMAYWLAAWQDTASGGWVYDSGTNYPEIGGECTAAVAFGQPATDVIVDDDFTDQAAVDVYNLAQGTDYVFGYDAFGSIQNGVNAVTGSTVTVLAGTYVEQVHITLSGLELVGAGVGSTTIQSPVTLTDFFVTGTNDNYPVIFVDGATGVNISDLTVDGDNQGDTNYRFSGIAYWNGGGAITDVEVINIMNATFSGAQHGVGVYAYNDTGGPYTLALNGVVVDDFQKTAVALSGDGLTVDLDDVTTTGEGPTSVTAQNGIQVGYGAVGNLDNCQINDVAYTGEDWTASGLMILNTGVVTATGVDIDGCQTSVYWQDSSGIFDGGTMTNPLGDAYYGYSTGAKGNEVARPEASPFDTGEWKAGDKAAIDVTVSNSTITGAGATDSWGLAAWGYGPITFTVTGCEITGWDWGVVTYDFGGATFATTVNENGIFGNTSYGMYSNGASQADASCNWWGDIGGPDYSPFNPNPGVNAVSDGIKFWPWLDSLGGTCDQYGSDSIAAEDASACLTPGNTCTSIPVVFNRTDTEPSRGISVTFELSAELVLCTGNTNSDIIVATGVGAWAEGYSNLNYQITDHGAGSYTVDMAMLGMPCGPTTGGDLFTIDVAKAPAVIDDAVGTVTVTRVLVRDCDNMQLPGLPGAAASVTIDLTSPGTLADLTATQVKTGNDDDGTTEIDLAWTAPGGDAASIEIYRKGFGDYPEYDDGTGVVPTPPVTIGNGWALVATLAATATTYVDETTTRDFWYYAAYVTDTCGNVSAATGLTGGTLNYHLGDVSDGITQGQGNNQVFTEDMSHLGANYGIVLAHNDPLNYLDSGPTTDYLIDSRPATDNNVNFEDLMVTAINYNLVSKQSPPIGATHNEIVLKVGPLGEVGDICEVELYMYADGQIQGLSIPLDWNRDVVEPIGVQAGSLLPEQGGNYMVLTPGSGIVDAALLGVRSAGISGEGLLATVRFRVLTGGEADISLLEIVARDATNQAVVCEGTVTTDTPSVQVANSVLRAAVPNPFNPSTELSFVLAREGKVTLSVYSLRGRLVRTLINEQMTAGPHMLTWNGTDDAGQTVSSGSYLVRLVAPDRVQNRQITLVK